ncbi:MAG: PD-(D/E)XK nuclease-like domain-containing protein [Alphaproteobacteria bacterium]|nr:PD-(D/E)XK nuclease-like domain-containing protein [Alphaproteobacteria bacterium]
MTELNLVEHAEGIYIGQRFEDYRADWALGSGSIKTLVTSPPEWWWDSPFNTLRRPDSTDTEKAHFRLGTATHVALLEGMDVFEAVYGVAPSKKDFPNHLDTNDELKEACREFGLPVSGKKDDLIERLLARNPKIRILKVEIDAWEAQGKIALTDIEWGKIMRLHRIAMRAPGQLATTGGEFTTMREAFTGGLSEVSVFWVDEDGIRQRARFDKIHPNATVDLKTFANWTKGDFRKALLREVVVRGYTIQAAHYDEARRQLRRLFAEGKVFGGTPEEIEILKEIAAADEWAWIWVFAKTAGAPLVQGVLFDRAGSNYTYAAQQRATGLANFAHHREFFGLEPDVMWFDPEAVWAPGDEDFPPFAMLGD